MAKIIGGDAELPYEKYVCSGAEALSEEELLAIILRTGTYHCSAKELAGKVLSLAKGKETGLNALHHLSLQELMSIPGIGEVKAIKLKCLAELAVRMARQQAKHVLCFTEPATVAEYYMESLRHEEKEKVFLLMLDNKLGFIEDYLLSVGTVNAALLSAREIFIQALRCGASNLMLLHNHPSGDPWPGNADITMTQKIKQAGELMDIHLIDHIIVGDKRYVSMKEEKFI